MKRSAFMTIEVLISLVIISMGVVTVTSALKTFYRAVDKQKNYEEASIALLSINDSLSSIDFEQHPHTDGEINQYTYTIDAEKIASQRSYVVSDVAEMSGHKGAFEIHLYKLSLTLTHPDMTRKYTLYQTRTKKLPGMSDAF